MNDNGQAPPSSWREVEAVLKALAADSSNPGRILELYYWSQEPQLLDLLRAFMAMPPTTRAALEAFVSLAGSADAIAASWESPERLMLLVTEPDITEICNQQATSQDLRKLN